MTKHRFFLLAAALAASFAAGCIPEGEESVRQEVDFVRQRAYQEWKAARDRGETREATADGPLSLDDAVKLALRYSKPMQRQVYEREIARGDRMSDYSVILPSVSMSAGYSRTEDFGANADLDNYNAGLSVSQPIWNGAGIPARLRSAQLNVALADEGIRETVQNLISDVATTYYDILLARHMVETHKEALASAEAQLRMVTEKRRQETATDYDVLRAQVDVATYRASMIAEQNNIDSSRVRLLKLMGVSQDSNITFSDKLEFLPMRPVFERAVEVASGNRADLRQAEISARMHQEAIRIAQSSFFPYVAGTFDQRFSKRANLDGLRRNPWEAGLSASVSFGADNWGNLRSTRAQARQAEIDLLNMQEETLMEIRQEMNNLNNREEMVKSLQVNQSAAREALRLVLVGYQAGVKTEVDVTDARKALTDVQGQYYQALADHTKSRLNLQLAMGVLGPSRVSDGTQLKPDIPIANIEEFAATDYTPPDPITMPVADDPAETPAGLPVSRRGDEGRDYGKRAGDASRAYSRERREARGNPDSARKHSRFSDGRDISGTW